MAELVPRLCSPFLVSPYLADGGTGVLFAVSDKIVVKTLWKFDIPHESFREQETDSVRGLQKESEIYDILAQPKNWHPNIVLSFLHNPSYLFLERLPRTLHDYVSQKMPIPETTRFHWIYQITDAVTWLEQLQIAHGDLRPPNILLDHDDNVKLCDFDNSYTYGEYIQGAHRPYYKLLGRDGFGEAGAASEQFAIGSCAYYIHKGEDPNFTSEGGHNTGGFPVFGAIIRKCWDRGYPSIMALKQEVWKGVKEATGEGLGVDQDRKIMKRKDFENRVKECREYLLHCSWSQSTVDYAERAYA
jgi:serine/threonine protein kinase